MFNLSFARIRILGALLFTLQLAAACGGGGDTATAGVGSGGTGYLSGVVTKGPVSGTTVTAYAIAGGQPGVQVGTATTDVNGGFSMSIGTYAGSVLLQTNGGNYTDEATGATMSMAQGDVMSVAIPNIAAGATTSGIQVTPVTAMAQAIAKQMAGGMTDANIAAANTAMGSYFSVTDIVHVQPMNPLVPGSGASASQDAQNYGMTLAAMSKYAQLQGMVSSSAMVTAMMNDAADGIMDGRAGGVPVTMGGMMGSSMMPPAAGTTGLGAAMNAFMSSTQNKSGITTPALMNKLMGSTGHVMGGGGGMTSTSVSGTVFNGPMTQATVTAFAIDNGMPGARIASVATDGQGNFTMPIGSYSGAVMLQVSGGTYTDAATGTTMTMGAGDLMSAVMPAVASGTAASGVWLTAMTSMAQARAAGMAGGMTDINIAAANTAVGNYFSVGDILKTRPMDPTVAGPGTDASQDARNYGMSLAAMSQYAENLNMSVSSAMVTAMTSDAADGIMDGMRGRSPISMSTGGMMGGGNMSPTAGAGGLAAAMTTFMNSAVNASGMTAADMAALIQKLANCDGRI
ncbi:MAG: hypothetical protein MUF16_11910 [Burkholderiaceae bacterium]|jgi:hypothetical protein|nr:hypothetical protein [Burkholderiaceae bacterium]